MLEANYMVVIGRYFSESNDFINVVKLCRKYKNFLESFRYNPISDPSLFPNMIYQNYWKSGDVKYKINGMKAYIHWYSVSITTVDGSNPNDNANNDIDTATSTVTDNDNDIVTENDSDNDVYKEISISSIDLDNYIDLKYYVNRKRSAWNLSDYNLVLPKKVTKIEYGCFEWHDRLKYWKIHGIELPIGLKTIESFAFKHSLISKIILPNTVTTISHGCFEHCTELSYINLPNSLKSLEQYAFAYSAISNIEIPDSVTSMSSSCFSCCSNLTSVKLSKSLKSISERCFEDTSISTIIIPDNIKVIENRCFENCTMLTKVILSSKLEDIQDDAFSKVYISDISLSDDSNSFQCIVPLFIKNMLESKGINCPRYSIEDEDIKRDLIKIENGKCIIPNGVMRINGYCFYKNTDLKEVILPDSLEVIGDRAFSCTDLKQIDIPKNVKKIFWYCFENCKYLNSVNLENKNIDLGYKAFYNTPVATKFLS